MTTTNVLFVPLCSDNTKTAEIQRCVNSILGQEFHPFDWDLKVVCNTNDPETFLRIKKAVPVHFEVIQTESNGGNGKGHNSVLDLFKNRYRESGFTHLVMIDGDDFYYPSAFECIDELMGIAPWADYMSVGQHADSVRRIEGPVNNPKVVPIVDDIYLLSDLNFRYPIKPFSYWDGANCPGGEVTLYLTANAVECDLKHLEYPMIPDDYTHMLWAVKAHVKGRMVYCNTDCNDIYVYDKTNPIGTTNQPEFRFQFKDWPADARELVTGQTFECLRNVTRQDLPFVTLPQIGFAEDKVSFIRDNLIS